MHFLLKSKYKNGCFLLLFLLCSLGICQEFSEGHNFCELNPCKHGGSCRSMSTGYVCQCPPGTTGYSCENDIDDCAFNSTKSQPITTKCQLVDSNSNCTDLLDGFRCTCSEGFRGKLCDITDDEYEMIKHFPGHQRPEVRKLLKLLMEEQALFAEMAPFFVDSNRTKRTKLSWTPNDLFIWASFAGKELDLGSELVRWNDPTLGNCFTLGQSGKIFEVAEVGESYGLQIMLRVNEDEYLPWIESASVNTFIQQKNEHIFPNSVHYSTPPGNKAQFTLRERINTRLGDVYGTCANRTSEVHTFYYPGIYTVIGCLQSCYQNQVHLVCGCTDPRFLGIETIPVCGPEKALCVLDITRKYGDPIGWDSCVCPEQCYEETIDALWYSAPFTSRPAECWHLSGSNFSRCLNSSNDQVLISVFFKSIVLEQYNEVPAQTFNDYLFVAGGITGIIAGFSFISIIEFVFFCYRTFLTFCTNEYVTAEAKELQFVDEDDADFDVFVGSSRTENRKNGEAKEKDKKQIVD